MSHPHARLRRWHSSTGTATDFNNGRDILELLQDADDSAVRHRLILDAHDLVITHRVEVVLRGQRHGLPSARDWQKPGTGSSSGFAMRASCEP